jgi:hypothetical protein
MIDLATFYSRPHRRKHVYVDGEHIIVVDSDTRLVDLVVLEVTQALAELISLQ